ncbi:E3 ubiquitin-protein ligase WAV3-like [Coffea arabica]|uniref:E3 ubiquitin-protein ligase WAV3-like n=1 Tax=Coffea arabica TaxID=13443 RepID=A0A6P6TM82_COFAR
MVLGWRKAFCTSISRDRDSSIHSSSSTGNGGRQDKISHDAHQSNPTTPKLSSKLSFFSIPSTPRLQSQLVSSPRLRCRTTPTTRATSTPSTPPLQPPESPKRQCKTAKNSPRFFQLRSSTPSSPRSPSTLSLLKSTLRISSKTRCGICLHGIKSGQGMAIFTAECSHSFHFPCVAGHVRKQGTLACPVCNSTWTEMPLLSIHNVSGSSSSHHSRLDKQEKRMEFPSSPKTPPPPPSSSNSCKQPVLKVYNDDEPLMSPTCGARFNPIPESDENGEEDSDNITEEFQGFYPTTTSPFQKSTASALGNIETKISPEAAVISIGRSSQTFVVVLKIRAPPAPTNAARRAPIDLVMVLDVSRKLTNEKLQMMKRALRLVVSSLSPADRLSIVAFSSTSKRLLPLRRMTAAGRRSARRIVDSIVSLDGTAPASANDAIKKAAKVLEDRREKNPVASIILLSDAIEDRSANQRRQSSVVCTTRVTHYEVPVLSVGLRHCGAYGHGEPPDDSLAKCVGGLLSVVVQDLRVHLGFISGSGHGQVAGVYSFGGRPMALGSGLVRLGELFAEEERELLVELKVPSMSSAGAHHALSVRCSYKDPSTQVLIQGKEQALLVPRPQALRSSTPSSIERLRSLFVATRAVAESRRLVERNDLAGAHQVLTSARSLVLQASSSSEWGEEYASGLEAELSELHWRRQNQVQQIPRRRNVERRHPTGASSGGSIRLDEKSSEPLTPTSAWRAAERLAKVAIMRKSMNRVSDLHGFENARF